MIGFGGFIDRHVESFRMDADVRLHMGHDKTKGIMTSALTNTIDSLMNTTEWSYFVQLYE